MKYKKYLEIVVALLPITVGGLIYIIFRSENILLFSWLRFIKINYNLLRQLNIYNNKLIYIIYSLPNGLWILTGFLLLKYYLKGDKIILLGYSILLIIISISIEIGQYYGIITGTYDILDVITIIIFSVIGMIINIYGERHEKI